MPRNAAEVLAEVQSYCAHPDLVTRTADPRFRVGKSLSSLTGSIMTNQAFIEEQNIIIAPKKPVELNGEKLREFFNEVYPRFDHQGDGARVLNGGILNHSNGRTYFQTLQLGAVWIPSEYPEQSVFWRTQLELDPTVASRVGGRGVDHTTVDVLPSQQYLTLFQMPNEDLADIAVAMLNHPNSDSIKRYFDLTKLTGEQVQMIHEGQDPFVALKEFLGILRTPEE